MAKSTAHYERNREYQLAYQKCNRIRIHNVAFNKNHCANKELAELLIRYKYITMDLKRKFAEALGNDQLYSRIWTYADFEKNKIKGEQNEISNNR